MEFVSILYCFLLCFSCTLFTDYSGKVKIQVFAITFKFLGNALSEILIASSYFTCSRVMHLRRTLFSCNASINKISSVLSRCRYLLF